MNDTSSPWPDFAFFASFSTLFVSVSALACAAPATRFGAAPKFAKSRPMSATPVGEPVAATPHCVATAIAQSRGREVVNRSSAEGVDKAPRATRWRSWTTRKKTSLASLLSDSPSSSLNASSSLGFSTASGRLSSRSDSALQAIWSSASGSSAPAPIKTILVRSSGTATERLP